MKLTKTALALLVSGGIVLTGCNAENDTDDTASNDTTTEAPESEYPFPSNATEMGEGEIIISTSAGTSEDDNVPVLFIDDDDMMTQIGLDLMNFDGSLQTYIYVNEMFVQAEQAGEMMQTSIDLSERLLEPGDYEVVAAQFENDDPDDEVIAYTTAGYEIKASK